MSLWGARAAGLGDGWTLLLVTAVPTIACFLLSRRPLRFALGIAVLFAAAESGQLFRGDLLLTERTFFGVHRVVRDPEGSVNMLFSGSTVHGVQSTDPARAREPLGYYHPTGPGGTVVSALATAPEKRSIAIVGVGTGALAVLAGPHQRVTLHEIDQAVLRIAAASEHFTYLANTRATLETVIGDGRVTMSRSRDSYDLIVLDAFSSSTVPLHLLTREAVLTYLDRLAPGGALLLHVSSRHLDLAPILASHARDLGLAAWEWIDVRDDDALEAGIFGSHWVLMARSGEGLGLSTRGAWQPLASDGRQRAWTDDFSNVLSIQRWR